MLIPPLALIFLVLGTIFLGVATPTEGGAMGATGALIMALARRRLSFPLLKQAMNTTAKLSTFVVFILVGARVFSLTFYGVNGHVWVEHLLTSLPGGQLGFLIVVNILIFVLAFFLDFFELSFIVIPLIGPVAEKLGIDLIWFGVLLGVNMQTSFMHPPFGFALFYLRSVAPAKEYLDKYHGPHDGAGDDRADLLGRGPVRADPGPDGRRSSSRSRISSRWSRDEGEGRHPEHPDRGSRRNARHRAAATRPAAQLRAGRSARRRSRRKWAAAAARDKAARAGARTGAEEVAARRERRAAAEAQRAKSKGAPPEPRRRARCAARRAPGASRQVTSSSAARRS